MLQIFIRQNGREAGPFTSDEVGEFASAGKIEPSTMLRNNNGKWYRADKVRNLFRNADHAVRESIDEAKSELSNTKKVAGMIAHYGLQEWWLTTFSSVEQEYIDQKYRPFEFRGNGSNNLITGPPEWCSVPVVTFVSGISKWFNNRTDRTIAKRMLEKSIALDKEDGQTTPLLDLYFHYATIARTYYPDRHVNKESYDIAISACRDQIAISATAAPIMLQTLQISTLPQHHGYKQLSIILEKEGRIKEAMDLCEAARAEGWHDDWNKRIARLQKKLLSS